MGDCQRRGIAAWGCESVGARQKCSVHFWPRFATHRAALHLREQVAGNPLSDRFHLSLNAQLFTVKSALGFNTSYRAGHESSWFSHIMEVECGPALCKRICLANIHTSEGYELEWVFLLLKDVSKCSSVPVSAIEDWTYLLRVYFLEPSCGVLCD